MTLHYVRAHVPHYDGFKSPDDTGAQGVNSQRANVVDVQSVCRAVRFLKRDTVR